MQGRHAVHLCEQTVGRSEQKRRIMIIKVNNINKTYVNGDNRLQVLKNVSFEVEKGEFLAIMGSSGSGKSTMMNMRENIF